MTIQFRGEFVCVCLPLAYSICPMNSMETTKVFAVINLSLYKDQMLMQTDAL